MVEEYNFLIGLKKTTKNLLIIWGPAMLAFLANVPLKYAWIAGAASYMIKNYIDNRNK